MSRSLVGWDGLFNSGLGWDGLGWVGVNWMDGHGMLGSMVATRHDTQSAMDFLGL